MPNDVFHFSDQPNIARFDPRPAPNANGPSGNMVWAIGERLRHNYLLPRNCPRVTFYASPKSDPTDITRFMVGSAKYVVAIERSWMPVLRQSVLYQYTLPGTTFELIDQSAEYFISYQPVIPSNIMAIDDLLGALLACDIELRITPNLWDLCDAIVASTMAFSCIRMRNASPRA